MYKDCGTVSASQMPMNNRLQKEECFPKKLHPVIKFFTFPTAFQFYQFTNSQIYSGCYPPVLTIKVMDKPVNPDNPIVFFDVSIGSTVTNYSCFCFNNN